MKTPRTPKFNHEEAVQLDTWGLDYDYESGKKLPIDSELYYSDKQGFFLRRIIPQVRIGRTWEIDCSADSWDLIEKNPGQRRLLEVYRPLSFEEVVRHFVNHSLPHDGGIRDFFRSSLIRSGFAL